MYSIMGGKIDNVYDILERLDQERIVPGAAKTNRSATESA
jgi:hypothetical protein